MTSKEIDREIAELRGWKQIDPPGRSGDIYGLAPDNPDLLLRIPRPSIDRTACVELLEYVGCTDTLQSITIRQPRKGEWQVAVDLCDGTQMVQRIATGDTLMLAVALACRDSLVALRETKTP